MHYRSYSHSLIVCSMADYIRFASGELVYDWQEQQLVGKDTASTATVQTAEFEGKQISRFSEFDEYMQDAGVDYDLFSLEFESPSGDEMIAFGKYGKL